MHPPDGVAVASRAIELDEIHPNDVVAESSTSTQERQPLIHRESPASSSAAGSGFSTPRYSGGRPFSPQFFSRSNDYRSDSSPVILRRSEDDSNVVFDFVRERLKYSKLADFANKIAVDHEPGLTSTQLMVISPSPCCLPE